MSSDKIFSICVVRLSGGCRIARIGELDSAILIRSVGCCVSDMVVIIHRRPIQTCGYHRAMQIDEHHCINPQSYSVADSGGESNMG